LKRGDIAEQSFAFTVAEDEWKDMDDSKKMTVRTITKVSRLYDVSPVTYPAYPDTSVALRSMQQAKSIPVEEIDSLLDDLIDDDLHCIDELLEDI
jgi:phage head maturation protease